MGSYNALDGVIEIPLPNGRAFRVSRQVTNRIKARYEDWLESRARKRVFRLRPDPKSDDPDLLTAEEYAESMEAAMEAATVGVFAWGGTAWLKSLNTVPGAVQLLWLLANEADRKLPADQRLNLSPPDIVQIIEDPELRTMTPEGRPTSVLLTAMKEVLTASPNFTLPPVGEDD